MFKLNTERTYKYPVTVTVYNGDKEQSGTFRAEYRVVPTTELTNSSNRDKRLLDLVLVNVEDIEVTGKDGKVLQGDELLDAMKADPATSLALVNAYQESITKKNRPRT